MRCETSDVAAEEAPHHDVLLGYLCANEVTQSFHRSFLDLVGHDLSGPQRLHTWAAVRSSALALPESRNSLCEQLLAGPAQWLFMLDSDMGFAADTLDHLLIAADPGERPVVGGLCFAMREARTDGMGGMETFPSPTILQWQRHDDGLFRFTGQDHYPVNSMIRSGATGGACILIHRSVIERIGGNWFTREPDQGGKLMGEDVSFCNRVRDAGLPLWIHTGVRTTHFKHVWLSESDFWSSRVAPPAEERVDVIIPTLGRPQSVAPVLRSLRASTGLADAIFVCEPDDTASHDAVRAAGGTVVIEACGSLPKAWNAGYRHTTAPWVLLAADDVRFRPAWLDQALDVARRYDADVVGTNDLVNPRTMAGELATHPLIRRSYIEEVGACWDGPGVLAHEGYHHLFIDDEITMAARLRGKFQAALGSHVEHLHPAFGSAEMDDTYRRAEAHQEEDAKLFQRRLRDAVATSRASAPTPRLAVPKLAVVAG